MVKIRAMNLGILNISNERMLPDRTIDAERKASDMVSDDTLVTIVFPITEDQLAAGPKACNTHASSRIMRWAGPV